MSSMKREHFLAIEKYAKHCMNDIAHDIDHVYRVLYASFEIAANEAQVNYDILIAACLLHDIGRDNEASHEELGARMAYDFIKSNADFNISPDHVSECISTHRYRVNRTPKTIEAKILFDSDKLDVCGLLGVARTILYDGMVKNPIYKIIESRPDDIKFDIDIPSFISEYHYKLENVYSKFYTAKGRELAERRQNSAKVFYNNLVNEISELYKMGSKKFNEIVF